MCMGLTDFDVTTDRLQNQSDFQGVFATSQTIVFTQFVMLEYNVNFLEQTLILQPARSGTKIGRVRAYGNTLNDNPL